ncbi:hypothetical protein ACSHWB_04780 [Lentzea sp. HUAS TT2]|uniref:hypothetical protein n=1 Tax=Lentzea sp. HUAS TT2 TaxID=3447454 RepID=UPI003F70323A
MRVLALTCALSLLGAGVASAADPSTFEFDADANAFPITATQGTWTTPQFVVSQRAWDDNTLHIDVSGPGARYTVDLSRHDGTPVATGTHTDQKALVINKGLGCRDLAADYTVDRLDLDDQGVVTALDLSLEHRCGDSPDNALLVNVHYVRGA